MTPSAEVDAAFGAAPDRIEGKSAVVVLAEKRQALETARKRYKRAKDARDEQFMSEQHRLIDELRSLMPELEAEARAEQEAAARAEAEARMLACKRGQPSKVSSVDVAERKAAKLVAELEKALTELNDAYEEATKMPREVAAGADRFDLPKVSLSSGASPANRDIAITLSRLPQLLRTDAGDWQPTEQCEHRVRTRRTYREAAGTPIGEIIERAGLQPFRELTAREKAALADQAVIGTGTNPELAVAAVEATALSRLGAPGGNVFRG